MRDVTHRYEDPLDRVWLGCAERVGLRVVRTSDAYATTDGRGTVGIATAEAFDADDCLAQMIFHELCHSLVEGPDSLAQRDWGLDNESDRDFVREHACLRLQALLARPYGLRWVLAPTTDFRAFYDALPLDPLAPHDAASSRLARLAATRVGREPWGPHVEEALTATARIVIESARYAPQGSLLARLEPAVARHASGFPLAASGDARCGQCAWRDARGRCRQAGVRVGEALGACERFESTLDCQQCGACCREGYDTVEIGARDPVRRRHPELVVVRDGRFNVARNGARCAALEGGFESQTPYACRIYEARPKPCRDLAASSENCLVARRRVGLSR